MVPFTSAIERCLALVVTNDSPAVGLLQEPLNTADDLRGIGVVIRVVVRTLSRNPRRCDGILMGIA